MCACDATQSKTPRESIKDPKSSWKSGGERSTIRPRSRGLRLVHPVSYIGSIIESDEGDRAWMRSGFHGEKAPLSGDSLELPNTAVVESNA